MLDFTGETTSAPLGRNDEAVSFRLPRREDGPAITQLIADCPPLDTNSAYCNLLQATHFSETCVVAEQEGRILGWISAYRPPTDPDSVFVWQVAVHPDARGRALGSRILDALAERPALAGVTALQTTITKDNKASWALFQRFADRRGARLGHRPFFERDAHFAGAHDTEHMVRIEPI